MTPLSNPTLPLSIHNLHYFINMQRYLPIGRNNIIISCCHKISKWWNPITNSYLPISWPKNYSRHNNLEDRTKLTMTTHNCCQTRRRASLLDAASALASLGGTPPPVQYRIQETDPIEIHEMPLDDTSQSLKLPTSLRCDVPMPFPDRVSAM